MKFLILGSDGQLGTDVVKVLKEKTADFYPACHKDADITESRALQGLLTREQPDAVINCTAFHDMNKSEENPQLAMETNALAVGSLARICSEQGAKLMTLSSDYVFDGTKVEGYSEEDAPNPQTWYGKSKLVGEWMAMACCKRAFVVRVQSLYGVRGPKGKGLNFVDLMLKLSKERDELKVDQCRMAPTWTYALAKNMIALIETDFFGLYHMSCNGSTTWYEFAKKIMELTRNPVKVTSVPNDFFPRNFKRPENTYLINRKLQEINLDRMPDWETALKDYLKSKSN